MQAQKETDIIEGMEKGSSKPKLSVSSDVDSTTTSGTTTTNEMMERRDEPLADLAPTSEAIHQQKQKHATGGGTLAGSKVGTGEPSKMRRRKLGTGSTGQPDLQNLANGGNGVATAATSTSIGSGSGTLERGGGKGKLKSC